MEILKTLKNYLTSGFKNTDAGFFEYLFAITSVISILPSVICYFIIVKLILQPATYLVKRVWK